MTTTSQGENRINPRSTGFVTQEVYRKHTSDKSLAPEAAELRRCKDQSIKTAHVSALELVEFDAEANTLTTQRVHGKELFHTLWNSTYLLGRLRGHKMNDPDLILARVEELGQWLARYHQSTARGPEEFLPATWLHGAIQRKIAEVRHEKLLPERTLQQIEARFLPELEKLHDAGYLQQQGGHVCHIHGDFLIYNVLIDANNNLHVVDFGDTRLSGNLEDVARMYSSLYAIADTNRTRRRMLGDLPARFLAAYGLPANIIDTPYFQCNLVYNYLTHLEGQFYMREMLSWSSNIEMGQITRAGLRWIKRHL